MFNENICTSFEAVFWLVATLSLFSFFLMFSRCLTAQWLQNNGQALLVMYSKVYVYTDLQCCQLERWCGLMPSRLILTTPKYAQCGLTAPSKHSLLQAAIWTFGLLPVTAFRYPWAFRSWVYPKHCVPPGTKWKMLGTVLSNASTTAIHFKFSSLGFPL